MTRRFLTIKNLGSCIEWILCSKLYGSLSCPRAVRCGYSFRVGWKNGCLVAGLHSLCHGIYWPVSLWRDGHECSFWARSFSIQCRSHVRWCFNVFVSSNPLIALTVVILPLYSNSSWACYKLIERNVHLSKIFCWIYKVVICLNKINWNSAVIRCFHSSCQMRCFNQRGNLLSKFYHSSSNNGRRRIITSDLNARIPPPRIPSTNGTPAVPSHATAESKPQSVGLWASYMNLNPWSRFLVSMYFCGCGLVVTWVADDGTLRRSVTSLLFGSDSSTQVLKETSSSSSENVQLSAIQKPAEETSKWAIIRFAKWVIYEAAVDWEESTRGNAGAPSSETRESTSSDGGSNSTSEALKTLLFKKASR